MKTDYILRAWMYKVGISSFSKLQQHCHLSRRSMDTLRQGRGETLRYIDVFRVAEALEVPLQELMDVCSALPRSSMQTISPDQLLAERSSVIEAAIVALEPWLLQWPLVLHALQQKPDLPLKNFLPLLRPFDKLLAEWHITPIGAIGEIVSYDPTQHESLLGEPIPEGDLVEICYVGYLLEDKLLYRAKVRFSAKDG